jgi:tRNA threonylcarbamoyladenosine biosynthesis protein TsaE
MPRVVVTSSAAETEALAAALARDLRAGHTLLLEGDLGAGKTVFVRGLAAGLGADPAEVSSPTFTLLHEYRGSAVTLYHADLYRLDQAEAADLGLDEAAAAGVLAVEWPGRLADPPPARRVRLERVPGEDDARRITIEDA